MKTVDLKRKKGRTMMETTVNEFKRRLTNPNERAEDGDGETVTKHE